MTWGSGHAGGTPAPGKSREPENPVWTIVADGGRRRAEESWKESIWKRVSNFSLHTHTSGSSLQTQAWSRLKVAQLHTK